MAKKEIKEVDKKGKVAKSPFILGLIGGILYIILGIILFASYHLVSVKIITNPELFNSTIEAQQLTPQDLAQLSQFFSMLSWVTLILFLIASILILIAAYWLKKERTMRRGAITSLIVGILSINIFVIIAGALGLAFSSKKR